MSHESVRARAIFIDAVENVPPENWREYLDEACADDATLRDKVQRLLDAQITIGSFMDKPAAAPVVTINQPITEKPGTQIGHYKLLQQIGEGGMGVVYMAEQTEPVERRLALKIIKPGMDTRQVIARFEAERQALAMMDHPNIAKVLDAGTTDSGRPYFVMELVKGVPVTQYCDEQHLTPKERLELFLPVCKAVQHAHQKGIIHRDLKPSNILVSLCDGQAIPKVIDFGVAKAISQKLTEKTAFTHYGQIVGTIEYMSPEQARLDQLDVDTRSDIYSLGVLLYELLTGETPFDKHRLRSAAFDELLRIVREEEPPKPSTRLSSSETLASIAANRRIEPRRLSTLVRGELDWIVMKALEKDRGRRYETASKFAEDIQNYLSDEPVVACPPSAGYKFRKFARRNKAVIGTTAAIAASLVVGIIGTSWQAYLVGKERDRAMIAEGNARDQAERADEEALRANTEAEKAKTEANRADQEAEKAKTEAAIAKAVNEFLNNDLLGMADAESQVEAGLSPDPNIKLRTLLDRAAQNIEGRFSDQPLVEAAIRRTLGETYRQIGAYREAEEQLQRALKLHRQQLGNEHSDTLDSMILLTAMYDNQGRYPESEKLTRETLAIARRTLGNEHRTTLICMQNLATAFQRQSRFGEAEQSYQQALDIQRRILPNECPDTLSTMNNLATLYIDQGRYLEADKLLQQTLDGRRRTLGNEHPGTLQSMRNLALVHENQGRYEEAEKLQQQTLEILKRTRGEEHPATLDSMLMLADVYLDQGRCDDAEKLQQQVLEIHRRILGNEHPDTLAALNNLAGAYFHQGRYADAEKLYQQTMENFRRILGNEHKSTLTSMSNLANVYLHQDRYDEAEKLYREALEIQRRILGNEHPDTLAIMNNLAFLSAKQGRYPEAEKLYQRTMEICQRKLGDEHPDTLERKSDLAKLYMLYLKRYPDAEKLLLQTLDMRRRVLGNDHPITLSSMFDLAYVFELQGRLPEAEQLYRQTLAILQRTQAEDFPLTKSVKKDLIRFCKKRAFTLATAAKLEERDRAEAVRLAQEAVDLDPTSSNSWGILGWVQYRADDWRGSLDSLQKSCELQNATEDSRQWIVMALAHWKLATIESGLTDVDRAMHRAESQRLYEQASQQIARWWKKRPADSFEQAIWDFRDEAERVIEEAIVGKPYDRNIAKHPDDPSGYQERAAYYERRQQFDKATSDYLQAFDLMSDSESKPNPWWGPQKDLAVELAEKPEIDRRIQQLRRDDVSLKIGRFRARAIHERWDQAEVLLEDLTAAFPEDAHPWQLLAAVKYQQGNLSGYRELCKLLLDRFANHDFIPERERTVRICLFSPDLMQDRRDQFHTTIEAALAKSDEFPEHYRKWFPLTRCLLAYREGQYDTVPQLLEAAQEKKGLCRDVADLLMAMTEYQTGQREMARQHYDEAVAHLEQRVPAQGSFSRRFHTPKILTAELLRREAQTLIIGESAPKPKQESDENTERLIGETVEADLQK